MDVTLFAARLLFTALFVVAGLAKLFDLKGSQKAITDFGLPPWAAKPLGIGLPLTELCVAALLVPVRSAWIGAIAALALLLTFSAAIAINIALGRRPQCHCFGQVHSEPIGSATFARNAVLTFMAGILVWQARTNPGLSLRSVTHDFTAPQLLFGMFGLVTLIALAGLFWLVVHLFRQNGRLLLRMEALEASRALAHQQMPAPTVPQGLPIGAKASPFDLPNVRGGKSTLDSFLTQSKAALLIFTDPNCGPCNALMPEIAGWQRSHSADVNVVLISNGQRDVNRAKADEFGVLNALVEKKRRLAEKYRAFGTPSAVVVRQDGSIGSQVVSGADGIRRLFAHRAWEEAGYMAFLKASAQPQPTPAPKPALPVGSKAPAFALPDLNGNTVSWSSLSGQATVLLFWNPGCGFCQKMLPQLREWERTKSADAPRLVLVSAGSREANREMNLRSIVLIEENFALGKLYGANGTPSAVLIGVDGKIASALGVGAPGVLPLLADDEAAEETGQLAMARVN